MRKSSVVPCLGLAVLWLAVLTISAGAQDLCKAENVTAGLPLTLAELSGDPGVIAQCETICKTEQSCGTLPSEIRGDCLNLCRSTRLTAAVRRCMAATNNCVQFADCAELQEVTPDIPAVEAAPHCDKTKRVACSGVPGGCGFPQVCCTEVYGARRPTRVHLCGRRHCPWYSFGQGPWCGCPKTKQVYGCD